MYVRWKKQKRSKKVRQHYFIESSTHLQAEEKEAHLLVAYLVEGVRIGGKPRQKILCYLGSINEEKITNVGENEHFWKSVDARLKALHLNSDQEIDVEQKLQMRIPKMHWEKLYDMCCIAERHPHLRSRIERMQLEEFRKRHNLPGDEVRPL